jgi:hypothetical protein
MDYSKQLREVIEPRGDRPSFYQEVMEEINRSYPIDGQSTAFLIALVLIPLVYKLIR